MYSCSAQRYREITPLFSAANPCTGLLYPFLNGPANAWYLVKLVDMSHFEIPSKISEILNTEKPFNTLYLALIHTKNTQLSNECQKRLCDKPFTK
jgi:hypothetical protein